MSWVEDQPEPILIDAILWPGRSGCDAHLDEIVRSAWWFLRNNLDLVRWAACWAGGAGSGDCLVDAINGAGAYGLPWTRVQVHLTNLDVGAVAGAVGDEALAIIASALGGLGIGLAASFISGIFVYAGDSGRYWDRASTNWKGGDDATKACVALDSCHPETQ